MNLNLRRATGPLVGTLDLPGDKSISHRAVLMGLIASGPCTCTGWLDSEDTRRSLDAVRALGATVTRDGTTLTITPPPAPPAGPVTIDCGNSGTTARLLMGILSGWLPAGSEVVLGGDASLESRPMARVVGPLGAMGADIAWLEKEGRLPVRIRGADLVGRNHDLAVPSAQVKSALLLAGLFAAGSTRVAGAAGSRDHTEKLLSNMGISTGQGGYLTVEGPAVPGVFSLDIPVDPSTAAFFQVAAAMIPGSRVAVPGHSLNRTRAGALRMLKRAGAVVEILRPSGPADGEPVGEVVVSSGELKGFVITATEVPALIDEIPVLAVLATQAEGETLITGAEELRVKESDRLALMARNLKALGAVLEELPDGLRIQGATPLKNSGPHDPVVLETGGDHRVAMAMAIAGLIFEGHSVLDDRTCVAVSFPEFFEVLDSLLDHAG